MHKKINTLKNKKILICVTGSIAAFKACEVIRLLMKQTKVSYDECISRKIYWQNNICSFNKQ